MRSSAAWDRGWEGALRRIERVQRSPSHRRDEPHRAIPRQGCTSAEPASVSPGPERGEVTGRFSVAAQPGYRSRLSSEFAFSRSRQTVLAVVRDDPSFLASLGNGQLGRTFGTLGLLDELLSELAVAKLSSSSGQSLSDVRLVDLVPGRSGRGSWAGGVEPERVRIEVHPSRGLRRRVAELEAKLDGGQRGRRALEQQIAVSHRMQGTGAPKGASDLNPG